MSTSRNQQRRPREQEQYVRDMQRLHARVHYLHEGGSLRWTAVPQQGVRGERTVTIIIDGDEYDAVYADRFHGVPTDAADAWSRK